MLLITIINMPVNEPTRELKCCFPSLSVVHVLWCHECYLRTERGILRAYSVGPREEKMAVFGIQPSATAQSSKMNREGNEMSVHNIALKSRKGERWILMVQEQLHVTGVVLEKRWLICFLSLWVGGWDTTEGQAWIYYAIINWRWGLCPPMVYHCAMWLHGDVKKLVFRI